MQALLGTHSPEVGEPGFVLRFVTLAVMWEARGHRSTSLPRYHHLRRAGAVAQQNLTTPRADRDDAIHLGKQRARGRVSHIDQLRHPKRRPNSAFEPEPCNHARGSCRSEQRARDPPASVVLEHAVSAPSDIQLPVAYVAVRAKERVAHASPRGRVVRKNNRNAAPFRRAYKTERYAARECMQVDDVGPPQIHDTGEGCRCDRVALA